MKYSISQTAKLAGISVRTLHYYHEIGVLAPSQISSTGYRYYDEEALLNLQQILFYRELGFPLKEIMEIMKFSDYNKNDALIKQKELLILKKQRIDKLIKLINTNLKGDNAMSFKEFDMSNIDEAKKKYADEVKEKWGNTNSYLQNKYKTEKYTKKEWSNVMEESDAILKEFALYVGKDSKSNMVQSLVKVWQDYITHYHYDCTKEILAGLAEMYVGDERFTKSIDKFGKGTAKLMSDAIKVYCNS